MAKKILIIDDDKELTTSLAQVLKANQYDVAEAYGSAEGLKKLLSEIYYRPMVEQRNIIETELANWTGSGDQIDDITIIGVRI